MWEDYNELDSQSACCSCDTVKDVVGMNTLNEHRHSDGVSKIRCSHKAG